MQEREAMISQLQWANEEMWRSGRCEKWSRGVMPPHVEWQAGSMGH